MIKFQKLPFQSLPKLTREKMFISRPEIFAWILVDVFLILQLIRLLVCHIVLSYIIIEYHVSNTFTFLKKGATGEHE